MFKRNSGFYKRQDQLKKMHLWARFGLLATNWSLLGFQMLLIDIVRPAHGQVSFEVQPANTVWQCLVSLCSLMERS